MPAARNNSSACVTLPLPRHALRRRQLEPLRRRAVRRHAVQRRSAKAQYPNLLADINAHDVAFSVFDGDLKAGGDGACSNDSTRRHRRFNTLGRRSSSCPATTTGPTAGAATDRAPAASTRWSASSYERQVFSSTHRSLGQRTIKLQRQSDEAGPYAAYSENARWRKGPVVYVTLNVQGSNDNYAHLDVPRTSAHRRTRARLPRSRARMPSTSPALRPTSSGSTTASRMPRASTPSASW